MAKPRPKNTKKDNGRRGKKKTSVLTIDKIDYGDYKDVNLLKRFISDRAKIRARRVSGNDTQQQAEIARAIKNAPEMALIPYSNRVTQQRSNRGDRDRGRPASEPPPTPSAPPPSAPSGVGDDEGVDTIDAVDAIVGTVETVEIIEDTVETTEASTEEA